MPTKMRIHVTEEILKKSAYCGWTEEADGFGPAGLHKTLTDISGNCAIALAIQEVFPNARVSPGLAMFYSKKGKLSNVELPMIAKVFIMIFDRSVPKKRMEIPPFSFDIDVPDEVIDDISLEEITASLRMCKTMKLV